MSKRTWPTRFKKQTALLVHLLFLCLMLAGVSFIYFNENFGRGLSWVQEESYADTFSFTEQLETDVDMIFKYVNYRNLLEKDGDIDYQTDMVCVTYTSGRTVIYTLDEMIRYAKSLGYYLTDNYEVAGGPAVSERDTPDYVAPLIEWKAYDPNEVYLEPGDQYATREELSVQVLSLLGDYYRIKYNYIDKPSNLYFRLSYMDADSEEFLYSNAGDMSNDEIRSLGRYLYISGDMILMDTNLKYVPDNITAELESYNLYGNNNYYIILGIDTDYPNQDPYSIANSQYEHIRFDYITGFVLFILGGLGAVISLIVLAMFSGRTDNSLVLHFDSIPVEISLILMFACIQLGRYFSGHYLEALVHLLVNREYWDYSVRIMNGLITYFIVLIFLFSYLRSYKAGTLWHDSAIYRIYDRFTIALKDSPFPMRLGLCFSGYLFTDAILLGAFFVLYQNRTNMSFPYLYLIVAVIFVGFQVWVFLLLYRNESENDRISEGIREMSGGHTDYKIDTEGFSGKGEEVAENLNNIGLGLEEALNEQVKGERLRADLITNVSHDIKTPLTSIINYVDLLKRENIQDEKVQGYLDILDQKSQRLKTLTEDLVEASKASSGNVKMDISSINFVELIQQTNGEFEERFETRSLELVSTLPDEPIYIAADGRHLWRVLENLYNNAFKYAMENSRVYVDVFKEDGNACFTIKNVSANPLNINADELTERFVRGDVARTTEGSGLGLSIARDLTRLLGGTLELTIDGDLFKAKTSFAILTEDSPSDDEVVSPPGSA